VYSFVCDGHGGEKLAAWFGHVFDEEMKAAVSNLKADATAALLVQTLQACYHHALEATDRGSFLGQGTTISAALLQLGTMVCATLALGDCRVLAVDLASAELVRAKMLIFFDEADPTATCPEGEVECITSSHDFANMREVHRYEAALQRKGCSLRVRRRRDASKKEQRMEAAIVDGDVVLHQFVEPSRTVESMGHYSPEAQRRGVPSLQRSAEYGVWQLPREKDVALCVVCDGFVSKCALPSTAALAQCVCDPGRYLKGDFLSGTVLGGWIQKDYSRKENKWWPQELVKPGMEAWSHDPLRHTKALLRHIAPDELWKNAIDQSFKAVSQQAPWSDAPCRLIDDPEGAAAVVANMPVLLGSDDNVTLEAIVVTRASATLCVSPEMMQMNTTVD